MRKAERHNALLRLIASETIGNQAELASRLSASGFKVTQASVSRDLDELRVVKVNGHYILPRPAEPTAEFDRVDFDTAGETLIVGRCPSGLASAITVRIDAAKIESIVGTLAGDDTIFIAVKNSIAQNGVLNRLKEMFPYSEGDA